MDDYGKFRNFHKGVKLCQLLGDEEKEDYDESYKKTCFIAIYQIAVNMDKGHN